MISKSISGYRSAFHANFRLRLGEHILIPAITEESVINIGAETAGDLIRGARTSLCRMDIADAAVGVSSKLCVYIRQCACCVKLFGYKL